MSDLAPFGSRDARGRVMTVAAARGRAPEGGPKGENKTGGVGWGQKVAPWKNWGRSSFVRHGGGGVIARQTLASSGGVALLAP